MSALRRSLPVAAWGAFLLALAAVALIFRPDSQTVVLGFGLAVSVIVAGGSVLRARRGRHAAGDVEYTPDLSVATVVAAVGVSLAIAGAEAGTWLVAIGLGIAVAGVGGLVRELRAERRERTRVRTR
jgi:hypothetical protein